MNVSYYSLACCAVPTIVFCLYLLMLILFQLLAVCLQLQTFHCYWLLLSGCYYLVLAASSLSWLLLLLNFPDCGLQGRYVVKM